jgi:hypothetical protein
MISLTPSTAVPFASQARRPVPAADKLLQPLKAQSVALPSLTDMRDQQKSRMKEFAARKVQAVRERMDALKLMVKLDPKAALKMTAELAKELRSAVKAYVEAGGKNPTSGEMKMAILAATEARTKGRGCGFPGPGGTRGRGDEACTGGLCHSLRRRRGQGPDRRPPGGRRRGGLR